jgi:hypothetical protein
MNQWGCNEVIIFIHLERQMRQEYDGNIGSMSWNTVMYNWAPLGDIATGKNWDWKSDDVPVICRYSIVLDISTSIHSNISKSHVSYSFVYTCTFILQVSVLLEVFHPGNIGLSQSRYPIINCRDHPFPYH